MFRNNCFKLLQIILFVSLLNINVAESFSCYACTSENDVNCITMQQTLPTVECTDKCYTYFANNITYRGCKTDLIAPTTCNSNNCKQCTTGNCNNIKVPTTRRSCYQCSGADCLTPSTTYDFPCVNFIDVNDKCYSTVKNNVVYRGCESDSIESLGRKVCIENDKTCDICTIANGKSCNNYKPYAEPTLSCVHCDSSVDGTCHFKQVVSSATKCTKEIIFSEQEYCYTYQVNGDPYNVKRGCLLDETDELKQTCLLNPSHCKICSNNKNGCNINQEFVETCLTCDSKQNGNCLTDPSAVPSITCDPVEAENLLGCYHNIDENGTQRGCVSSLKATPILLDTCQNGKTTCKTCIGERCNIRTEFQTCYKCNSTTDLNCAQITNIDILPTKVCDGYTDVCQMYAIRNGATERGCDKELERGPCVGVNSYCLVCPQTMCNNYRFPRNRMECHSCQVSADCADEILSGSGKQFVCENFVFFDRCYAVVDEEGQIYRGCETDNTDGKKKCDEAGSNCHICNTMGCNYAAASRAPTLKCIKCDASDPGCAWGYDEKSAVACTNSITIGHTEKCFQHENSQGQISRGCYYDQPEVCKDNDECVECFGDSCNNRNVVNQSCVKCRSDNPAQAACATTGDGFLPSTCSNDVQLYENRGCYVLRADNVIIRGCANDLVVDRSLCEDNDSYCKLCMDNGCNTMALSGATGIFLNTKLQIILLFAFILLFKKNIF